MTAKTMSGIAILTLFINLQLQAQYTFDVKTQLYEKQDLQVLKEGLRKAIDMANWASNQEVGEKYSLWITKLDRFHFGDSLMVSAIVELRTPAMFSKGRFISGRHVTWKYDWEKALALTSDTPSSELLKIKDEPNSDQLIQEMSFIFSSVSAVTGTPLPSQLTSPMFSEMTSILTAVYEREPSPVEVLETLYVSQLLLNATKDMIKN